MMNKSDVFVKLSVKNLSEFRSHIVDKSGSESKESGKYIMCAGKYDKNGWTIVFKAKNFKEAEDIINRTQFNKGRVYTNDVTASFSTILC